MPTIFCYGDSNTHGTVPLGELGQFQRYPPGLRWPDVMASELGRDYQVISEGLPGRTTVHDDPVEGGSRSGIDLLPGLLASHVPISLMMLMLGTNDLKPRFSVTAIEIARSLERLVVLARATVPGLDVMLVAPAPVLETGCLKEIFEGAEEKQKNLSGCIREAARRQGCGFVDAGHHVAVSSIDGVHWEAEGHRTFGVAAAETVRAHLAD